MKISVVIPAYNEGVRLPKTLKSLCDEAISPYLGAGLAFEVLIVEDGSRPADVDLIDQTLSEIKNSGFACDFKHLTYTPNQGKGAALDYGFRHATGDWVGFIDADGSTSSKSVGEFFSKLQLPSHDNVLIGSRILMLGRNVQRNPRRHYIGRVFATLFFLLFRIPVYDSQCGCKFFKRSLILPLLDQVLDRRWVWDTQLLVLCFESGAKMREIPVDWQELGGSHVSMLRDPLRMLLSLVRFRFLRRKHLKRS